MQIAIAIIALLLGGAGGFYGRKYLLAKKAKDIETDTQRIIDEAKTKAKEESLKAKEEAQKITDEARDEEKKRREQIAQLETKLIEREGYLTKKEESLDKKNEGLEVSEKEIEQIRDELLGVRKKAVENLEKLAGLDKEQAKEKLLAMYEKEFRDDILNRIKKVEEETKLEADKRARGILATAVQRMAWDHTSELMTTTVDLPNDELKGRIIGKEGRNIQAFSRASGVDVIVDDTPGVIVISSFDPIRREAARIALEALMRDGRIQPARIEEAVEKAQKEVEKVAQEQGEQALYELGVTGIPPEIVKLLGTLHFRYSFGQNQLQHSKEVGHLAGLLAAELGADIEMAKKGGLLHDIGKAVDHEIQGPHALIGADIAKKYDMPMEVVDAIASHLGEVEQKTIFGVLAQVADALSGGRPGGRREGMEQYIKRIKELEEIANSQKGVEKSFAIQAGREIRVIVKPEEIDDLTAIKMAKTIADEVEKKVKYPGQIKVNIIRETRAIEYAK